jgi:hypothetical protein
MVVPFGVGINFVIWNEPHPLVRDQLSSQNVIEA